MPHEYPQWRTLSPGKRAVICAGMAGCLFWMATDALSAAESSMTMVAAGYGLSAACAATSAYQALRWLLGAR